LVYDFHVDWDCCWLQIPVFIAKFCSPDTFGVGKPYLDVLGRLAQVIGVVCAAMPALEELWCGAGFLWLAVCCICSVRLPGMCYMADHQWRRGFAPLPLPGPNAIPCLIEISCHGRCDVG